MAEGTQELVNLAVLNGPNLNLLGSREPHLYGRTTLAEIEALTRAKAAALDVSMTWLQTDAESVLVEAIQGLRESADGAVINAAAFTHYSIAVRDALLAVEVPFVEVHLTNLWAREPERHRSVLLDLAVGVVAGFGAHSYVLGLEAIVEHLRRA